MAPDWFIVSRQPIRSQVSSLTQLLTLTTTQKFPPQVDWRSISVQLPREEGHRLKSDLSDDEASYRNGMPLKENMTRVIPKQKLKLQMSPALIKIWRKGKTERRKLIT